MNKKIFIILSLLVFGSISVCGQYYDTGHSPASQHWRQIGTDSLRIIYPKGYEDGARRTLYYMNSVRPDIGYGFTYGAMRTPVVIHSENFFSNGVAMLAPKRIEIVGIPSMDTYANPWLKQLSVHEYRHMVQYNNINRSTVKALSYIFGQQVSFLATGLLPFWFIEGDAVMAETQFSNFGRGMQPSFSMHYRAMGREMLKDSNPDMWFCGSYKEYVPSHYELGYQLVSHSRRVYGDDLWDKIAKYSADYPFLIFTTQLGLMKYADTRTPYLFNDTFSYLNDYWDSLPERDDSATVISPSNDTYTIYENPLFIGDSTLLVLKTDFRKRQRFVAIDMTSGKERHIRYTGVVSSRPVYTNGEVWWSEYRNSTFWEQKSYSVLYSMKVGEWIPRKYSDERSAIYPVGRGDGNVAYIKYNYEGYYSLILPEAKYDFPFGISIHGLTYDQVTEKYYYIALADEGMWIEGLDPINGESELITPPSYTTISNLTASNGRLYFGSIQSGYDEAHMYDLATRQEYRLTTSRFGAFSPSPSPDGATIALTVYDKEGYKTATQDSEPMESVFHSKIPHNVVNPEVASWGVKKSDELIFDDSVKEESATQYKSKRYSKVLNMFNFHSWAPIDFNPFGIINTNDFDIRTGVTLVSGDVLNTTHTMLNYGYLDGGHSMVRGSFSYLGFAPKITVNATWSDMEQSFVALSRGVPKPAHMKDHFDLSGNISLPMIVTSGHVIRTLTPAIQYQYSNVVYGYKELVESDGALPKYKNRYIYGSHTLAGVISYSEYVRKARLDIIPRWGYALKGTILDDPFNKDISTTLSLYGRIYLPGVTDHHGISLATNYQKVIKRKLFTYGVLDILPKGYENIFPLEYSALSANYHLPLAYPDFGLSGVFFIKRIYASLGVDYANYTNTKNERKEMISYGGTLNVDMSFLRLPSQGTTTLKLTMYMPKGMDKPFFSLGFSVSL